MLRSNLRALERVLQASALPSLEDWKWKERIVPYGLAPVMIHQEGKRVLTQMRFSLLPSWAKEPKVKFATHNARIETVLEKPTWKKPFLNRRCVIPMTDFIEPIYEGEYAGNMVSFHQKQAGLLMAAGVWEHWEGQGEVIESFTILTQAADPFIAGIGHDRTPIFIDGIGKSGEDWLYEGEKSADQCFEALKLGQQLLELEVERDRPMRPGWEKRRS
jgi:putative SOS response-associated peptidase YedK